MSMVCLKVNQNKPPPPQSPNMFLNDRKYAHYNFVEVVLLLQIFNKFYLYRLPFLQSLG